jgi:hypothetical protein
MRHFAAPAFALLLLAPGCQTARVVPCTRQPTCADLVARIDRSDWVRAQGREVWKVFEDRTVNGETRPPRHLGYLIGRAYRQERGGPVFRVYEVTTLNQDEVRGRIDQLGRVTRYDAQRNGTFVETPLTASATREDDIGAILGTRRAITLEKTSERRLAFEALDSDKNGLLEGPELEPFGSRLALGDTNRDQKLDFAEFDAIDVL